MLFINRRELIGGLTTCALVMPVQAANGYRGYADAMLASPPRGAKIRLPTACGSPKARMFGMQKTHIGSARFWVSWTNI